MYVRSRCVYYTHEKCTAREFCVLRFIKGNGMVQYDHYSVINVCGNFFKFGSFSFTNKQSNWSTIAILYYWNYSTIACDNLTHKQSNWSTRAILYYWNYHSM